MYSTAVPQPISSSPQPAAQFAAHRGSAAQADPLGCQLEVLRQADAPARNEYSEVSALAEELWSYLRRDTIYEAIRAQDVVGGRSHDIQRILLAKANELGFRSEKTGLFAGYRTPGLRPDYYKAVGNTGVLMEVERGKTLPNNMDLLDLWKCHICSEAEYLFLVVPHVRQRRSGERRRTFGPVVDRLSSFFHHDNRINVQAAFVFGY